MVKQPWSLIDEGIMLFSLSQKGLTMGLFGTIMEKLGLGTFIALRRRIPSPSFSMIVPNCHRESFL